MLTPGTLHGAEWISVKEGRIFSTAGTFNFREQPIVTLDRVQTFGELSAGVFTFAI